MVPNLPEENLYILKQRQTLYKYVALFASHKVYGCIMFAGSKYYHIRSKQ